MSDVDPEQKSAPPLLAFPRVPKGISPESLQRVVRIPLIERAERVVASLSHSGRTLFFWLCALIFASSAGLLFLLNQEMLVTVPSYGGSLSEGITGSPRFINPLLSLSDAARDLSKLVFFALL